MAGSADSATHASHEPAVGATTSRGAAAPVEPFNGAQ